ncbi:MAG: M20/M25/M40 family metallo-hydrolase [Candidatus Coatesbacteria bacterium]|nr:MAG: M20/M25/M40 family metallo-hydrolase [Candidatus Coatesbacteria bacterium]
MGRLIRAAALAFTCAAAYGLPGELVALSDKEVRPDEGAGLYYLGQAGGGYLYNGSAAALGVVAPYRLLDREAQAKDYYIVWAPEWVPLAPEDFEHLGAAVRLTAYEILVGLERGFGPGDLRAVEHRIELIKLTPVTPVDWSFDGEAPPRKKDPRIAAAVNTITAEEYASYIEVLQGFKTRFAGTKNARDASRYIAGFFGRQGLEVTEFPFECFEFRRLHYPGAPGHIYAETDRYSFRKTEDGGRTWLLIHSEGTNTPVAAFWLDENVGFVVGCYEPSTNLAKTRDGGYTWEVMPLVARGVRAVHFITYQIGWATGMTRPPFLIKTEDGGKTWFPQNIPSVAAIDMVDFVDERHGWAASHYGVFYTDDGGSIWRTCTGAVTGVVDIAAAGPKEAWAATGYGGKLRRTTDGVNWTEADTLVGEALRCVDFPDSAHGYAAGANLVATVDGGATWREIRNAPEFDYDRMAFADASHGVFGDEEAEHLYVTDDGGATFANVREAADLNEYNVVGERRGLTAPEEIVIIGGHYDSYSNEIPSLAPGAEDNASGTACAMAAARAFGKMGFRRTVRYVAFGYEEGGLKGSRAYADYCAKQGEKIVAVLNADMVSYDEENGRRDDLTVGTGTNGFWLYQYLNAVGGLYRNRLIYDRADWSVSDDAPFDDVGYAAIGVIEGEVGRGGILEYPYYHTTEDTLDKLQPAFGARCARDLAATLAHLALARDDIAEPPEPGGGTVPFARPFAVYPNPYRYGIITGGVNFVGLQTPATVELYDLAGRRLAREEVAAGSDEFVWRPAASAVPPGVYFYRVEGQGQAETGKIAVTK